MSREMCAYAVADTSDLLPLYDLLRAELCQKGRLAWCEEECLLVCQARVTEKEGPLFLYCKGAAKLKGRSLAILEELLQLRDSQSKVLDRPPFKVLSAETLLEIAEIRPRTTDELSGIKGMTPGQISRHAAGILAAVARGLDMPEKKLPHFPRTRKNDVVDGAKERLKNLKIWRQRLSAEYGLDPGVLAPNWLLESLADAQCVSLEELGAIAGIREWQKQLFGQDLIKVLSLS